MTPPFGWWQTRQTTLLLSAASGLTLITADPALSAYDVPLLLVEPG